MLKTVFPAPISRSFPLLLSRLKHRRRCCRSAKCLLRKSAHLKLQGRSERPVGQSRENKPRMIITTDPGPQARLAPPRPPGCPASKVPTGRHAAPDENIHDGVCLRARRLPSIRLNKPGCRSQQRNKVKASESGISPTSRSKHHRQMKPHVIFRKMLTSPVLSGLGLASTPVEYRSEAAFLDTWVWTAPRLKRASCATDLTRA